MYKKPEDLGDPAIIRAGTLYVSPNVVFHLGTRVSET